MTSSKSIIIIMSFDKSLANMWKSCRQCPALVTPPPFYLIQIRHCLANKNVVHVGLHLGVQKPQELLLGQLQVLVPGNIVQIYTNRWLNRGIMLRSSHPLLPPYPKAPTMRTPMTDMALMCTETPFNLGRCTDRTLLCFENIHVVQIHASRWLKCGFNVTRKYAWFIEDQAVSLSYVFLLPLPLL